MPAKALAPRGLVQASRFSLRLHKVQTFFAQVGVKLFGRQRQVDGLAVKRQQMGARSAERQVQISDRLPGGQQAPQVLAACGGVALKSCRLGHGETYQVTLKIFADFKHQRGSAAHGQGVGHRFEPVFMGLQRCQCAQGQQQSKALGVEVSRHG